MGKQINPSWYENLYIQQVEGKQSTSFSRSSLMYGKHSPYNREVCMLRLKQQRERAIWTDKYGKKPQYLVQEGIVSCPDL